MYLEKIPTSELEFGASPIFIKPDPKFSDLSKAASYEIHWYGWVRLALQPKQIPPSTKLKCVCDIMIIGIAF